MNINWVIIHVSGLFEQIPCFQRGLIVTYQGKHVWDANHVKLPHLYVSMTIQNAFQTNLYLSLSKDNNFYIESLSELVNYENREGIHYLFIFILSNHYSHNHSLHPTRGPVDHPLAGTPLVKRWTDSPKEVSLLGIFRYCNTKQCHLR